MRPTSPTCLEVRGKHRERRGETHPPQIGNSQTTLSYTGLDKRRRSTTLRFDPEPAKLAANQATYVLNLTPREGCSLFVEIDCHYEECALQPHRAFFTSLRDARRAMRASPLRAVSIETSNEIFNAAAASPTSIC